MITRGWSKTTYARAFETFVGVEAVSFPGDEAAQARVQTTLYREREGFEDKLRVEMTEQEARLFAALLLRGAEAIAKKRALENPDGELRKNDASRT
jgi:hypothetical protein